jgi:hypothetical protein
VNIFIEEEHWIQVEIDIDDQPGTKLSGPPLSEKFKLLVDSLLISVPSENYF